VVIIRIASDAKTAGGRVRTLTPSPPSFNGTLDELCNRYVSANLPGAEAVTDYHRALAGYLHTPDPLFLVRAVRGTERRTVYTTRGGGRFKATDNAPAWWTHAALVQGCRIEADAMGSVAATMPAHLFDVSRVAAPTANAAGWHVAHIFPVKDGRTDYRAWDRAELVRRFVRNVHPCNYFLVPKADWQRWGGDPRVIAFFAGLYARRYADVWTEFLELARADVRSLAHTPGAVAYQYGGEGAPAGPGGVTDGMHPPPLLAPVAPPREGTTPRGAANPAAAHRFANGECAVCGQQELLARRFGWPCR